MGPKILYCYDFTFRKTITDFVYYMAVAYFCSNSGNTFETRARDDWYIGRL